MHKHDCSMTVYVKATDCLDMVPDGPAASQQQWYAHKILPFSLIALIVGTPASPTAAAN